MPLPVQCTGSWDTLSLLSYQVPDVIYTIKSGYCVMQLDAIANDSMKELFQTNKS